MQQASPRRIGTLRWVACRHACPAALQQAPVCLPQRRPQTQTTLTALLAALKPHLYTILVLQAHSRAAGVIPTLLPCCSPPWSQPRPTICIGANPHSYHTNRHPLTTHNTAAAQLLALVGAEPSCALIRLASAPIRTVPSTTAHELAPRFRACS